ncbi:MAG: hypothetical protein ACREC6_01990, partial [Hyphomicrobiaceae bacterium]
MRRSKVTLAASVLALGSLCDTSGAAEYDPRIDPADFTTEITNIYFSLPVGKKIALESRKKDG